MRKNHIIALGSALALGVGVVLASCGKAPRMPAVDGAIIEISRSERNLRPGDAGYATSFQLYWFGTACHLLQLGDMRVLTDPFVTNDFKLFGMASDPERVEVTLGRIAPPDGVLVNHSHHDHILDAYAAMSLPSWVGRAVPLYGGRSASNLLAGFNGGVTDPRWHAVEHRTPFVIQSQSRAKGYHAKITPFRSEHSPHLKCGYTFAEGLIGSPRTTPARNIRDFQAGEVFNYLLEMRAPGGVAFNVFYLGSPFHLDEKPESLPPAETLIDVAIILAPSADNVRGYPGQQLAMLRPRHIVLSHFNTFLHENPDEQLTFGGRDVVNMPKLSRDVQVGFARNAAAYPEFEKLHIPALTVMEEDGGARNVIRISE